MLASRLEKDLEKEIDLLAKTKGSNQCCGAWRNYALSKRQ